jgi:transaldolase
MLERFHFYIDSAVWDEVSPWIAHPMVYGVTTNPTLMARAGLKYAQMPDFVARVLEGGAWSVQVQVRHREADRMLEDAQTMLEWGPAGCVIPKIPVTKEGLAVAARLSSAGHRVTLTAVYAVEQALWANLAGAAYAAPYLGRLADSGQDALEVIRQMQSQVHGSSTRLLVASLRSRQAVLDVLALGVGSITVPPKLLPELFHHQATLEAENQFLKDAEDL